MKLTITQAPISVEVPQDVFYGITKLTAPTQVRLPLILQGCLTGWLILEFQHAQSTEHNWTYSLHFCPVDEGNGPDH